MSKMKIEGSFVALITPFNKDGSVDFEGFRTLIKFHEDNGTSAILFMGSTGEVSMLSPQERQQVIVEGEQRIVALRLRQQEVAVADPAQARGLPDDAKTGVAQRMALADRLGVVVAKVHRHQHV